MGLWNLVEITFIFLGNVVFDVSTLPSKKQAKSKFSETLTLNWKIQRKFAS